MGDFFFDFFTKAAHFAEWAAVRRLSSPQNSLKLFCK